METIQFISRQALAKRWGISLRTVDRLRESGRLPSVDVNCGHKGKPLVRFRSGDIELFEESMRQAAARSDD